MSTQEIDRLLKERQTTMLRERRAADRQPFTRPVKIEGNRESYDGFSRDMSRDGIALISQKEFRTGSLATLNIHSLFGRSVSIRAEARWSEAFGKEWFITGWRFTQD